MTPADYRKALLEGVHLEAPPAPGTGARDRLVRRVTRPRCAGPNLSAEPLMLARARALRQVFARALPKPVQDGGLDEFEAWIGRYYQLEARAEALEAEMKQTREALEAEVKQTREALEVEVNETRERLESELRHTQEVLAARNAYLDRVLESPSLRVGRAITAPARLIRRALGLLRAFPGRVRRRGVRALPALLQSGARRLVAPDPVAPDYVDWLRRNARFGPAQLASLERQLSGMAHQPLVSIVMPAYNSDPRFLREAVDSVCEQVYPHWELLVVDDASDAPATRALLNQLEGLDARVRVLYRKENGHISAASNTALAAARGEWVGFLDHDDRLAPDALFRVVAEIEAAPDAGLIYSDEDKISESGDRYEPYFKPDWNPDLLRSQNYINHFSVFRKTLVDAVGGLREGFEGAQDYDLVLRVTERLESRAIRHIPRVLYHWRAVEASTARAGEAKPYAVEAARRALQEHLDRTGHTGATVLPAPGFEGIWWRVRYTLPSPAPRVSVIMPTRNGLKVLMDAVASVLDEADYPDVELILVDNASDDPATLRYLDFLQQDARVKVVRDERPFNFSQLNNDAVPYATGSVLVFLNNDVKARDRDWLRELVSHASRPAVGMVGASLLYADDMVQHAGCILGVGGVAAHAFHLQPGGTPGYMGRGALIQNYSAVTAACVAMRRTVFDEVGGFDAEKLKVAFNDIDLCLKVLDAGYRNVWTPYARLYHFESVSRGYEDTPEKQERFRSEVRAMRQRWGELLDADPAYNPNLSLDDAQFRLARKPRIPAEIGSG